MALRELVLSYFLKHQFDLYIVLDKEIKGLFCSGSRPSDSRSSQTVLPFFSHEDEIKSNFTGIPLSDLLLYSHVSFVCFVGEKKIKWHMHGQKQLVLGLIHASVFPYAKCQVKGDDHMNLN